ncbi:ureidoglycolate dehydrogenase [Cohnella silvisoli]|uniref:Ureidoglycolate dehydrogenase n=1 Tax=Cohnella silvisoli TaxID=2873699 RepID=A0ABV1KYE7_9BACL|nr:ureidoglycolate dehydrogenase [Cohnella silvisoli]MCD9023780.1 ureidoglycolate dehydrogenase [Cohnella silvisoli]
MSEKLIGHEQLHEWCVSKLKQVGISDRHAGITADVLIHANLRGVDSHGVLRMEHYVQKVKQQGINSEPDITVKITGPVTAIVDGDDGLGHVVAEKAMSCAIELAHNNGVGIVSAINSSHCGALSYFVEMAAREQLIGIAMTNTDKMVVPFGGSSAYFGTNPMAFGFPAGNRQPIVIDMATSSVAYGKILEAIHLRKPIPADWAVDSEGQPITDPHQFNALLPFGGPKGYGLGMVVDIFAGILTGSPFGPYIGKMYGEDFSDRRKLGHFVCAFDISKFTDQELFTRNITQMMDDLHNMPPAPGFDRVILPGEPECLREQHRRQHGIPISEELYTYLCV